MSLQAAVTEILAQRVPQTAAVPPGFRRAAVLIPIFGAEADLGVLLTKRTELVPTHKGQISFPGGGFLEGDADLRMTALRESSEEIGLRPEDVRMVGVLDDAPATASAYIVRPFVGFIPHPYAFRLDPFEIERVITLPLLPLLAANAFREEIWERDGQPHPVYFYDYEGDTIWGLTARILRALAHVLRDPFRARGMLSQRQACGDADGPAGGFDAIPGEP
jgi:8-oxo-dGTP pyrophosphatase MutT (NUDIX family)